MHLRFATFGSFVVIAAVVLILDTAAFNSGSSFATLKLAFNLALGSTEAENPAAVVFMNMADIWFVLHAQCTAFCLKVSLFFISCTTFLSQINCADPYDTSIGLWF